MAVKRALVSVSDKAGLVDFARGLVESGVQIVSSGGTATSLSSAGISVTPVAEVTGAPEILGGRVKTLHPKIHGGILADRRNPAHVRELQEHGIEAFDLVVCNLYPFERTVAHPSVKEHDAVEQIDIGGPAMVRAAAKNFHTVAVVVDPASYDAILEEIQSSGEVSLETRRALARAAFQHTAAYEAAISNYFSREDALPDSFVLSGRKIMELRYGETLRRTGILIEGSVLMGVLA
ncbi:MAG TPA: bifunctional phosphoribosylaminoimidazolecarboxamide formyltransferase/IMP cyclohydrolase, partial [Actinomycetota bacterium]|nr:bifunctional phosphoribosylaminoimidazolecarboxamide formyltransferase/IMP cyclohydrolase [Actinomycetota bacterium]